MPKTKPEGREILGAAVLVAAASGASAHIGEGDTLITEPLLPDGHVAAEGLDLLDAPLDWIDPAAAAAPRFLEGSYLVADQHDGTWAGGVGRDVVRSGDRAGGDRPSTGDRTRTIRDRLSRGGVAGSLAVIAAFAVLAWTAIRRRMR